MASAALVGCERDAATHPGPELAQSYLDAGPGVPNPMPGTPIAGLQGAVRGAVVDRS